MIRKLFQIGAWICIVLFVVLIALFGLLEYQMQKGIEELEQSSGRTLVDKKMTNIGTTRYLRITPLINWHAKDTTLKTEMGVSHLIETDSISILFDLGFNKDQLEISPLQHNMNALGVQNDDYDVVYITHNHLDHVGGKPFMDGETMGINPSQEADWRRKKIYTPIDMTYPKGDPKTTKYPFVIAEGVASIGTIPRQLFLGRINEQSLAINVEGKGIVLIIGCAHQRIPNIIERTQALFNEPIYGIVGDLHLPVPEGRMQVAGIDLQRLQSGESLFDPISKEDVNSYFDQFEKLGIQLISIGGHDSSDEVIMQAKKRFGEKYIFMEVGRPIEL